MIKGLPVVLGLGSNLGDSSQIILDASEALKEILTGLRRSSLYETEPMHVTDQNRFINAAVMGLYSGPPGELLSGINEIEMRFGRNRKKERPWGERFLDIDILLFGDLTLHEQDLVIPHPRLKERRFALQPLLELFPEALEPGTGLSYREICDALPEQGVTILKIRKSTI